MTSKSYLTLLCTTVMILSPSFSSAQDLDGGKKNQPSVLMKEEINTYLAQLGIGKTSNTAATWNRIIDAACAAVSNRIDNPKLLIKAQKDFHARIRTCSRAGYIENMSSEQEATWSRELAAGLAFLCKNGGAMFSDEEMEAITKNSNRYAKLFAQHTDAFLAKTEAIAIPKEEWEQVCLRHIALSHTGIIVGRPVSDEEMTEMFSTTTPDFQYSLAKAYICGQIMWKILSLRDSPEDFTNIFEVNDLHGVKKDVLTTWDPKVEKGIHEMLESFMVGKVFYYSITGEGLWWYSYSSAACYSTGLMPKHKAVRELDKDIEWTILKRPLQKAD